MEAALERGNLVEALSHLDTLIKSCPPEERSNLLAHHKIKDVPTLHYLSHFNYRTKDIPSLNKLIKIFTTSGYDVNSEFFPNERPSHYHTNSFTALLASISAKESIFVECLLRNGARADACTPRGLSPCHLAIKMGDLACLQTLVKFGGNSILATPFTPKLGYNNPVLHTAVSNHHPQIVSYLLSNKEFPVDVTEKAVNFEGVAFTPLQKCLTFSLNPGPVARILLGKLYPDSRFSLLYFHLVTGDTEAATDLLAQFSAVELAHDKIEDRWPLHCLPRRAFDESRVDFTKKLILNFVRSRWDVNSEGWSYLSISPFRNNCNRAAGKVDKCTLLHLACYHGAPVDMLKWLVEVLGADVNCKTEGDLVLTPLLISIARDYLENAEYLVENGADLNVRGSLGKLGLSRFMKRNLETGELEPFSGLNAVEFLVRTKDRDGLKLLKKMLSWPGYLGNGADEFHLALEGNNFAGIYQVLKHYGGLISNEDLLWMATCGKDTTPEMVPTIHFLLSSIQPRREDEWLSKQDVTSLVYLLHTAVNAGLDLSLVWEKKSVLSIFQLLLPLKSRNMLGFLKRILKMKPLLLNSSVVEGPGHVQDLLLGLSHFCYYTGPNCRTRSLSPDPFWVIEASKILISHGLDLSGMVIEHRFDFHFGCSAMYKMMFAAGFRTSEKLFKPKYLCPNEEGGEDKLLKEIGELDVWRKDFDKKEGSSLKHFCRLQIRKQIKFVGDLDMLAGVPEDIQDFILCKNYN